MSDDSNPRVPEHAFDLEEVAAALMRARNIREGLWRLAVKMNFQAVTTQVGPDVGPTAVVQVAGAALFRAESADALLVFDAAELARRYSDAARLAESVRSPSIKGAAKAAPSPKRAKRTKPA